MPGVIGVLQALEAIKIVSKVVESTEMSRVVEVSYEIPCSRSAFKFAHSLSEQIMNVNNVQVS